MTCNICGMNEASIHLTEIVNDQMIEIHLCEACAAEKGTDFKTHFNLSDILAGVSGGGSSLIEGFKDAPSCPECGMAYDDFSKTGRLGCPQCYTAFAKLLTPLIKRVHRATHHVGKRPSRISADHSASQDLKVLQDRLNKCIEAEEFEEAAHVRDEIRQILEKVKKKGKK